MKVMGSVPVCVFFRGVFSFSYACVARLQVIQPIRLIRGSGLALGGSLWGNLDVVVNRRWMDGWNSYYEKS